MSKKSNKLSRTFPGRVKNETKSRQPLPSGFKRFADFLTLRRKKRKGDSAARQLEKSPWFHGKITAEYAEMLMRGAGEFLVREDPAMPGMYFIAVRNKEQETLHLAITKVNHSKGTRIKYRVEDSDYMFDGIPELIQFYISERRPVSIRPPAVLTIAISKESALLKEEDFRGRTSTAGSARIHRTTRGRLERKRSDPVLSTRVPSRVFNIEADDDSSASVPDKDRPHSRSNPPSIYYDDKQKTAEGGELFSSATTQSLEDVLDPPQIERRRHLSSSGSAPSLYRKRDSGEGPESTYDSPRSIAIPTTTLKHVSPYGRQGRKRSQESGPVQALKSKEGVPLKDYATPSSLPVNGSSNSQDELDYDVPRPSSMVTDKNNDDTNSKRDSGVTRESSTERDRAGSGVTECAKPRQTRQEIYQSVLQKLRDKIVRPFLEQSCVTLARYMTKVDLDVVWTSHMGEGEGEPEGVAEGLELLILPQGRDIRSALIERYTNLTYWVGALVVAAGDLGPRTQVVTKLIELADVLSDKHGNLVSFMAVLEGLALPQVTRLHHTWSCLHHQYSSSAIMYHSTLKPLAGLLSSGAPSPFPGVCLPYVVPLAKLLEMTTEDALGGWGQDDVVQGIETLLAHLDAGRTLIQQLDAYKDEYLKRSHETIPEDELKIMDYFRSRVNVGDVLGLGSDAHVRTQKLVTLLNWLSENAERASKPSAV
ncbi:breast cancer anti-estrogen resistance protein 3 homolog [Nematostella vectensis]|uniref:breast cancer anti-estrogen resistance protein 3 homolog n=1 Tax=Nematostella vectensis TaxID=45351 RepID=UPI0013905F48|nr:breast cancer anti-estrogen resistance protein 3 homolog [Nematostella vectensis]